MIAPGFEPGASAVSEQRSNRAELRDLNNEDNYSFINVVVFWK